MLRIPLLRRGVPYESLDVARVAHPATGRPFVEISQANAGLMRRDLRDQASMRAALAAIPMARLVGMVRDASSVLLDAALPLGRDVQRPDDYVEQVSTTTGMPHAMVRRSLRRVADAMANVEQIVRGLTRGLAAEAFDRGVIEGPNGVVSIFPHAQAMGIVLPSNSPGVHGLWVPAIAMKTPLVVRPGSAEPWTPYRIMQALMHVGVPAAAFDFFPCDHAGAGVIVQQCGRSMFFGDLATVGAFAGDPRIELHGPGYSKILVGADAADGWREHVDVMVASIAENGGRSCVNASGVWTPRHGLAIARALAERLSAIVPRAAGDPDATLAPFVAPAVARSLSQQIDAGLREPGAVEITAAYRSGPRLVEFAGGTYLLPTVIHCASSSHPLANREFLFPFVSVVDVAPDEMAAMPLPLGPTLVVTALTADDGLVRRLLDSDLVGRLNVGAIPTHRIAWDQPHEGNLFEHLYGRRAYQRAV